jgi:hypothetical protein
MSAQLLALSTSIAPVFIILTGLYFLVLGATSLVAPHKAEAFLMGFVGTSLLHYAELVVRLLVGGAMILHSSQMLMPEVFRIFGWVLVITTAGLCLVPWRQHQRFAQWSVPQATRFLPLIGITSLVMGGAILTSVFPR